MVPCIHIILLVLGPSRMIFKTSPQSKTEQCYINLEILRVWMNFNFIQFKHPSDAWNSSSTHTALK